MMKKISAMFLAVILVMSLAACGGSGSDGGNVSNIQDSLELLNTVWGSYEDAEKFAAAGGDMTEENMTMDAPGKFGIEDTDALDATLGFPAASVDKIDGAASIMHMMNANTFTCGVFHAKSADDVADLTTALKDNISARQWMCGIPEVMVIAVVDDYVVSCFGASDIVETFKTKLSAAYSQVEYVCEEPVA